MQTAKCLECLLSLQHTFLLKLFFLERMEGVQNTRQTNSGKVVGINIIFVFKIWKFWGGGKGSLREIPSMVRVWMFSYFHSIPSLFPFPFHSYFHSPIFISNPYFSIFNSYNVVPGSLYSVPRSRIFCVCKTITSLQYGDSCWEISLKRDECYLHVKRLPALASLASYSSSSSIPRMQNTHASCQIFTVSNS